MQQMIKYEPTFSMLQLSLAPGEVVIAEAGSMVARSSNLPTFPQLFINGELIGGCDIVLELFESGELKRIVEEASQP